MTVFVKVSVREGMEGGKREREREERLRIRERERERKERLIVTERARGSCSVYDTCHATRCQKLVVSMSQFCCQYLCSNKQYH